MSGVAPHQTIGMCPYGIRGASDATGVGRSLPPAAVAVGIGGVPAATVI